MAYTVDIQDIKVAVDVVAFAYHQKELYVLLVQRKFAPFEGQWVIPGGFVSTEEELEDAAIRELREETNLEGEIKFFAQTGAYGKVDRDPRRRIVSVAYMILLNELPPVKGETDAQDAKWWKLDELPTPLAFDHDFILEKAKNKLRYLVRDTDAGRFLLGESFSGDEFSELLKKYLELDHDPQSDLDSLVAREVVASSDSGYTYQ